MLHQPQTQSFRNSCPISVKGQIRFNIFDEPERVAFPSLAFAVGAWFWRENAYVINSPPPAHKSSLGALADGTFVSFVQMTHALTGKLTSLRERAAVNDQVLDQFRKGTIKPMRRGQGVTCQLSDRSVGYAVPICLQEFKKVRLGDEFVGASFVLLLHADICNQYR